MEVKGVKVCQLTLPVCAPKEGKHLSLNLHNPSTQLDTIALDTLQPIHSTHAILH